uniref:BHLH domain-containing protein n=1 Tax=Ananas comosus var. bracteatus TaxID=296719 RepID=A0A6V7PAE2_ANACO|nr:unnamed protein product [Ananas comosus var. bracteatus]
MGPQSYGGAPPSGAAAAPPPQAAASSGSGAAAPPRQRVRARRGQATDPHSIAERLRRERIAERMKALQELVPNANKTDKASMLDEIIDYVKFLQLQVKVLSMSRLGGAAAVAPLVANMSSEGGNGGNGGGGGDSLTVTEHQVAKLMEEDMGSAMQYLQGKGLCLMPISLASAISSATCHPRPSPRPLPQQPSQAFWGPTHSFLAHRRPPTVAVAAVRTARHRLACRCSRCSPPPRTASPTATSRETLRMVLPSPSPKDKGKCKPFEHRLD